ncbi:MAG TPA: hypothetical protein VNR36_07535 [Pseudolysinimonas sp.]|nr:hypothetical protein [Pseudolysinimonas sp.]
MTDAANSPTPPEPVVPAAAEPAAPLPAENLMRGTLLALAALPAGVIAWAIVSAIGFVSGWLAIGVALLALWLYRKGSGGRIGFNGATRVSIITVVTLIVAFVVGIAVANPIRFNQAMSRGTLIPLIVQDPLYIVFPVVFGVLGIVAVYRTAATQRSLPPAAS